jgi:hypothetical protein
MVIDENGLRPDGFPVRTSIDLLRPVAPEIHFRDRKKPDGRCLCQDQDYRSRYSMKFPS